MNTINKKTFQTLLKRLPVYSRKRAVTQLPVAITPKRLYILPTKPGIIFLLVLFVMLTGSINYNNNLGILFTFLLSGMTFISMFHTHRNLSGISVVSISMSPAFAGTPAEVTVILRPSAIEHTDIQLNISGSKPRGATLSGGRNHAVKLSLETHSRGLFPLPPTTISTTYPFSLFRAWHTLTPATEYLVYPAPVPGPFSTSINTSPSDNEGEVEISGIDDFKELKRYQPGDPLSRISWKAFSRGRGLYTKEFTGQTGSSVVLDWETLREDDTEIRLSRLCDMILKAHNMNIAYGLKIPGVHIEPGEPKNTLHKHKCLRALALYNMEKSESK